MSRPDGGWTAEQLREAVDTMRNLTPAHPATVTVERLDRTGPNGAGVVLDVVFGKTDGVERWRLTFDSMWVDVHDFPLADAALMVRANVVEWWDTRGQGPAPEWLTVQRMP